MNIARKLSDQDEAMYMANLAIAEQFAGEYVKALTHMHQALDLARKFRLSTLELNITINIGSLMLALKAPTKAISFLEDSLELINSLESNHLLPYTLHNLGIANSQLKNHENAIDYYFQALEYVETSGQIDLEIILCADIAETLLTQRNATQACYYLKRCFNLCLESLHVQYSLRALIYWSKYLFVTNETDLGLTYLFFVQNHSATIPEDGEKVRRLLKILLRHQPPELIKQAKEHSKKLELQEELESIVNLHMPPPKTIDSSQLTTSL